MNHKSPLLTVLFLLLISQLATALDVTIIARVPYEHLDATGQVDGANMTTPGMKFSFVRMQDGNVILLDPTGGNIMVQVNGTDYVPPRAAPTPMPVVTKSAAKPTPPPAPTRPPLDAETTKVNQMLGLPLFDGKNLWQENASDVGARLGWTKDSISSYRLYDLRPAIRLHMADSDTDDSGEAAEAAKITNSTPPPDPSVTTDLLGKSLLNCLGSHAYCSTLYTRKGKPDFLSIVFANSGDLYASTQEIHLKADDAAQIIKRDAKALQKVMTASLGDFTESGFGASANVREPAKRWDWKGTSFLLIHSPGNYVGVVICPTDFADSHGIRSDRDSNAVRADLPNHVKKGPNGDVYIDGIPSVDEGDKGYYFPASWERYLRYLDIPGDMYFFATAGDQTFGSLVDPDYFRRALGEYLASYQTHIQFPGPLTMDMVSKEIDSGHPIMWQSLDVAALESTQLARAELRDTGNWNTYLAQIQIDNTKVKALPNYIQNTTRVQYVKMRLIVGYNAQSNEVAISDCNRNGKLRWFTLQEVQQVDSGDLTVLQ